MNIKDKMVLMDTETLIPYHNNMLRHGDEQINILASIIAESGFDVPIVVDKDNIIIKGHGRRLAAMKLGLKQVPVIIRDDLTPVQVKAARISDNAIAYKSEIDQDNLVLELEQLQELNYDLGLTGYNNDELEAWLNYQEEEEDEGEEKNNQLPEPRDADTINSVETWAVIINCSNEDEQIELLERFTSEGLKCQALIS